jgi:hypothetical protein
MNEYINGFSSLLRMGMLLIIQISEFDGIRYLDSGCLGPLEPGILCSNTNQEMNVHILSLRSLRGSKETYEIAMKWTCPWGFKLPN